MPERIMYVQLKTGYDIDRGPAWISRVRFNRSWQSVTFRGRTLRRFAGGFGDANFYDIETGDLYWLSGPKRDRTDARYSSAQPEVDEDARDAYASFLAGAALPGRERG